MNKTADRAAPSSVDDTPPWHTGTRMPRASVRALVLEAEQIVAVENLAAPGKLHMPGGGIEHGETMLTALQRELREELCVGPDRADYLLAIENLFDTNLGLYHSIEHVFIVTPDRAPCEGESNLVIHRLPFASIGDAAFYPLAFRDLLTRPDWRDHGYLLAGKFAGDD